MSYDFDRIVALLRERRQYRELERESTPNFRTGTEYLVEYGRTVLPDDLSEWVEFMWNNPFRGSVLAAELVDVPDMVAIADIYFDDPKGYASLRFNSNRLSSPDEWVGTRLCVLYETSVSGFYADLSPGDDGTFGQILYLGDAGNHQRVVFNSITEMFDMFLELPDEDFVANYLHDPPFDVQQRS